MNKELIKEIIIENENFIMQQINIMFDRESVFLPSLDIKKACLIYGVRRSGKSFLLYNLFKQNPGKSIYIDFEDERISKINSSDLDKIREAFFELRPELLNQKDIFFLFDEIQNVQHWEKFVRRLVEKDMINVICAGSSSKITPNSIHTSLRGRVWSVEVMPFSFRELLKTRGFDLTDKKLIYGDNKILIKKCFDEYLKFGGFPEVIFSKNEFEKKKILKEYLNAMFFRDLVERYEVKKYNSA